MSMSFRHANVGNDASERWTPGRGGNRKAGVNSLIWLALVLFIIWLVVRVVFAVTGFVFHILWVVAVILFIVWLVRRFL